MHVWWPVPHSEAGVSALALPPERGGGGGCGTEPPEQGGSGRPFDLSLSWGLTPADFCPQAKYLTKKTQAASVEAVKMLDEILLQLSVSELGVVAGDEMESAKLQRAPEGGPGGGRIWRAPGPASSPAPVPSRRQYPWT